MKHAFHLLNSAIESINRPKNLQIGDFRPFEETRPGQPDGTLNVTYDGDQTTYMVEIKPGFTSAQVARLVDRKTAAGNKHYLLIAEYVTRSQAEALENASIEFLDTAGNCFLDLPGLFLFVVGNRKVHKETRDERRRMFTPSGLKIIFAFLTDPRLKDPYHDLDVLNKTYRQIAELTGVSPGTITWTRRDLEKAGFMRFEKGAVRQLVHKQELLEQWVTAYARRLRPKLLVSRFRSPGSDWWVDQDLTPHEAFWGGEVAAAKSTGHLTPEIFTIYQRSTINELILDLGLKKDPGGDVEVLTAFWGSVPKQDGDCVHPLLVYADLVASDIGRNLKVAQHVYEAELHHFAESD